MLSAPLEHLLHSLKQDVWVVTPNKHLAHVLMQQFTQEFKENVQIKPPCFSYKNLIHFFYDNLIQETPKNNHPTLLTDIQAIYLWQMAERNLTQNLPHLPYNSQLIPYSTWQLSKIWNVSLDQDTCGAAIHTEIFYNLANDFELKLHDLRAITDEMVVSYFIQQADNLPFAKIIFACFDDYTPQQKILIDFLISCNVVVEHFDLPPSLTKTKLFATQTAQDELVAFTNWAEQIQDKAPIALLVPNMERQHQNIKNWLKLKFSSLDIYFSLGKPLSSYPLVQHAIMLLLLLDNPFNLSTAKLLLNSPFIGGFAHECSLRIKLAATHPLLQSRLIDFISFLTALDDNCQSLAAILKHLTPYPETASAYEWEQIFTQRLIECGFPGDSAFTPETSQIYQRFIKLLRSFKELNVVANIITKDLALQYFTDMLTNCIFQPKQNINAPIHVLGLMEAAGSTYSAIWVIDLNEQNFPAILKPTPFIPLKIQQQLGLPHTSPDHELKLNLKRLERIQNSCAELILSYRTQSEDGLQKPSSLITRYQKIQFEWPTKRHMDIMEDYQDLQAIAFVENEILPHGAIVLNEQAKCPFRAFATSRLKIENLPIINNGLTPQYRGIILHKALEYFWQNIKTQAKLKSLDDKTIFNLVTSCAYKAIHSVSLTLLLPKLLKNLEIKRICNLILATLEWEKNRPYFEIAALEAKTNIQIGPLNLKIRLDRLDTVINNEKWVIDYKTSIPKPLPWQQDKPQEIQILLYALAFPDICAMLFHELNKSKSSIKGLKANSEFCEPYLKHEENWAIKLIQWKNYLTKLAELFYSGNCEANPIEKYTCKICRYKNLCRIESLID